MYIILERRGLGGSAPQEARRRRRKIQRSKDTPLQNEGLKTLRIPPSYRNSVNEVAPLPQFGGGALDFLVNQSASAETSRNMSNQENFS